jgi:3-methyladenine DNA glycosylase AlkC
MENKEPFFLKNIYSPKWVAQAAAEIQKTHSTFDRAGFQTLVFHDAWPGLELKQRVRHIAYCLRQCLPPSYPEAVGVLVRVVERMIARDGDRLSFEWGILPDFVEAFGTDDPDTSLPAIETLTRLSSAEFAIRPFLLRYPERTYAQMMVWADHPSPMVRRLASEGFRPRLPWGMGIPVLKSDPLPILPILEKLKNDPAETVRRSVANNLNDISKDHPDLVLDIAGQWQGTSPETDWVVRHACRGLLKKGNARALSYFGFEQGAAGIIIADLACSPTVRIGDTLTFSFVITNTAVQLQNIRLEYAIQYRTSTGNVSRKVFKIKEFKILSKEPEMVIRRQRFTDFTTRKHFSGPHRLEIVVNGLAMAEVGFEVV